MASQVGLALALTLVLAFPSAVAHVARPWPSIQGSEPFRTADVSLSGTAATIALTTNADPTRHYVELAVDPKGDWRTEYRLDPPDADNAFRAVWNWTRLVEYKDLNADGRFEQNADTVVRSWRFGAYLWNVTPVTTAFIDNLKVQTVTWNGQAPGAPTIRIQIAVAGRDFTDEGQKARPQDTLVYMDVFGLPPRGIGNLHSFEGSLTFPEDASTAIWRTEDLESAFLVSRPARQAHLAWGGTAVLDGNETGVRGAIDEAHDTPDGRVAGWTLDLPRTERTMRFVMALGVEFVPTNVRGTPGLGVAGLLTVMGLIVCLRRLPKRPNGSEAPGDGL